MSLKNDSYIKIYVLIAPREGLNNEFMEKFPNNSAVHRSVIERTIVLISCCWYIIPPKKVESIQVLLTRVCKKVKMSFVLFLHL
jgi:hypothetical protein